MNDFPARLGPTPPLSGPSLTPSSPYYTQCLLPPMNSPRMKHTRLFKTRKFNFGDKIDVYVDEEGNRKHLDTHGQGATFGAWFEMKKDDGEVDRLARGREEGVGYNWVPIMADLIFNAPIILGMTTKDAECVPVERGEAKAGECFNRSADAESLSPRSL